MTPHHTTVDADLRDIADSVADEARRYLSTVTEVASGSAPDAALPLLLLAVSDILASGARLGATTDVVPLERFEPDVGPDPVVDPLRANLANVFEGIDEYVEVVDPLLGVDVERSSVSGDLVGIAGALAQGLRHYESGHVLEALWWWQFSYLSDWGDRALTSLRALQSILAHLRLDADEETVGEAEFDALHP
jgi:hypothetical protein